MIRFREFEALGCAVACMSEKSDGDCAWGPAEAEEPSARNRIYEACGVAEDAVLFVRQVHGDRIIHATREDCGRGSKVLGQADGLVTNKAGVGLGILVADCVPVYLLDPKQGVAGLVHAGRAGTRVGLAGKAVRHLGADPGAIHALIGPSAGPCCYEVSGEVADDFRAAGLPAKGRYLDLWQANAQQLAAAGVPPGNIHITGQCTICGDRFHSHRANANAGRNLALLML